MARGAVVVIVSDGWERGDPGAGRARDGAAAPPGAPHRVGEPAKASPGFAPLARRHGGGAAVVRRVRQRAQPGRAPRGRRGDRPTTTREERHMKFENAFVVRPRSTRSGRRCWTWSASRPACPAPRCWSRPATTPTRSRIKVKVGPMSMKYKGEVEIVERDDAAQTRDVRAKAKETRGQGTADAHVHMALSGEEGDARTRRSRPTSQLERQGRRDGPGRDRGRVGEARGDLRRQPRRDARGCRHGRGASNGGRCGPRARDGRRRGECLRARGDRRPGDGCAAGVRPARRAPSRARPRRRRPVCRWASSSRASWPAACRIRRRSSPGPGSLR